MASTTNDMSLIRVLSPGPKALTAVRNWLPISHALNIVEDLAQNYAAEDSLSSTY